MKNAKIKAPRVEKLDKLKTQLQGLFNSLPVCIKASPVGETVSDILDLLDEIGAEAKKLAAN